MTNYESFYNFFEDLSKSISYVAFGTAVAYVFVCYYVYIPMRDQGENYEDSEKKEKSSIEIYNRKFKKEF